VLSIDLATVRLFVHVLAAAVWVGGQITIAGLLPTARAMGDDAPRRVARAFNRFAWPAFAVLVVTGIWNLFAVQVGDLGTDYMVTLALKLLAVTVSGVAAAAHIVAKTRRALAIGGALSGLGAIAALFFGVVLHG
jgi:putative copper export protein